MAPAVEFSGDHMAGEDCNCKDLLKKLDSVLKMSIESAVHKAEEVLRNDLGNLLSTWMVPEMPTMQDWSSDVILQQEHLESTSTASPTEERIHFALIKAIVLVTVIAVVLVSTCRLVLQFVTRTSRITD